jgi:hypothetical protein
MPPGTGRGRRRNGGRLIGGGFIGIDTSLRLGMGMGMVMGMVMGMGMGMAAPHGSWDMGDWVPWDVTHSSSMRMEGWSWVQGEDRRPAGVRGHVLPRAISHIFIEMRRRARHV